MPRRWTNSRTTRRPEPQEEATSPKSYESMARALVEAGKASPTILTTGTGARYRREQQESNGHG